MNLILTGKIIGCRIDTGTKFQWIFFKKKLTPLGRINQRRSASDINKLMVTRGSVHDGDGAAAVGYISSVTSVESSRYI